MGFEPILSVPQTDVLTINTINTVVPQGFEPQLDAPKTSVLPLYQRTICTQGRTRTDTPFDTVSKTAVYTIPPLGYYCTHVRTRTFIFGFGDRRSTD